jgi:hypothetical protein
MRRSVAEFIVGAVHRDVRTECSLSLALADERADSTQQWQKVFEEDMVADDNAAATMRGASGESVGRRGRGRGDNDR